MITNECIVCDACEPECPNNAITAGKAVYEIKPDLCTDCVGRYDEPRCKTLCPVDDAIIINPGYRESKTQLLQKKQLIERINSYRTL